MKFIIVLKKNLTKLENLCNVGRFFLNKIVGTISYEFKILCILIKYKLINEEDILFSKYNKEELNLILYLLNKNNTQIILNNFYLIKILDQKGFKHPKNKELKKYYFKLSIDNCDYLYEKGYFMNIVIFNQCLKDNFIIYHSLKKLLKFNKIPYVQQWQRDYIFKNYPEEIKQDFIDLGILSH